MSSSPSFPVANTSVPKWFRHYLTGVTSIAVGFVLIHLGQSSTGEAAIVAGLAFLGVGAGSSTSTT